MSVHYFDGVVVVFYLFMTISLCDDRQLRGEESGQKEKKKKIQNPKKHLLSLAGERKFKSSKVLFPVSLIERGLRVYRGFNSGQTGDGNVEWAISVSKNVRDEPGLADLVMSTLGDFIAP